MTRLNVFTAAIVLCGTVWPSDFAYAANSKPNIIVIVADDLGYGDLGVHGCKDIPTPNIDSLAQNGIRCTNGYVSHPYCSPTRAGLMTGRYQQRFGHEFNPGRPTEMAPNVGLPLSESTMADRLRAAGYRTGIVGKWHLGHADEKYHPLNRGFDSFFGFLGGAHSYLESGRGAISIRRNRKPIQEEEYLTDAFAREGAQFIRENAARPFFLYWAFNAVHGPLEAPPKSEKQFSEIKNPKRQTYAAMLTSLDNAIGRGLKEIREQGLEDNTLIFFISDNGGPEDVNGSNNGPFRGSKGSTFEGGIRSPFLVQWKGHLPAGAVYEPPVIQLDILPTAMAAGSIDAPEDAAFDGVNLLPYFNGENKGKPHDTLYWRDGSDMAVRSGDWKLVHSPNVRPRRRGDVNSAQRPKGLDEAMLFNLANDPGEATDLADANPEKKQELAATWSKWNSELAEPLWPPRERGKRRAARNADAAR
jgi:arylsulfatase A-like enzyme